MDWTLGSPATRYHSPVPEPSPTRILRRALEDALDTRLASAVLFEALGEAGCSVPQNLSELLDVLRGPLYEVLARRLDETRAAILVEQIEEELTPETDALATVEVPLELLVPRTEREDATAPVLRRSAPVSVSVLAEGQGLAMRLVTTLTDERVSPHAHSDPERWPEAEPPQIVILDAGDFPTHTTPRRIIEWGLTLPATTARVLWASKLPYGKSFQKELAKDPGEWLTFDQREGIEPLLDLIRSRRRSRG